MAHGWWKSIRNFAKPLKEYYRFFVSKTRKLKQDSPLYISEGSHKVLIKYEGDHNDNDQKDKVYKYNVDFSILHDSDGPLGYMVSYEDKAQVEDMWQKTQQYESMASQNEIAASYVHEIKNPLFSIRGFLQLLQQSFSEGDKRKEYTEIIISELDRINDLLKKLLSEYRENALSDKKEKITSVNASIKEVIALFQYTLQQRNVTCETDLCEEELYVLMDKDQFIQVVINLVQNSIDAMKEGGRLSIKTRKKSNKLCLEITDQGEGIKKDVFDKIFDPFFSTKQNGTGLGLYITKRILENNGGNIYFESTEGKGTKTFVELPLQLIETVHKNSESVNFIKC